MGMKVSSHLFPLDYYSIDWSESLIFSMLHIIMVLLLIDPIGWWGELRLAWCTSTESIICCNKWAKWATKGLNRKIWLVLAFANTKVMRPPPIHNIPWSWKFDHPNLESTICVCVLYCFEKKWVIRNWLSRQDLGVKFAIYCRQTIGWESNNYISQKSSILVLLLIKVCLPSLMAKLLKSWLWDERSLWVCA